MLKDVTTQLCPLLRLGVCFPHYLGSGSFFSQVDPHSCATTPLASKVALTSVPLSHCSQGDPSKNEGILDIVLLSSPLLALSRKPLCS